MSKTIKLKNLRVANPDYNPRGGAGMHDRCRGHHGAA